MGQRAINATAQDTTLIVGSFDRPRSGPYFQPRLASGSLRALAPAPPAPCVAPRRPARAAAPNRSAAPASTASPTTWPAACELGHPWVFRDALGGRPVSEPTGALVELYGGNRVFLARGFVDQEHPVAVRVLTRDPEARVHPGAGTIADRFKRARPAALAGPGPRPPDGHAPVLGRQRGPARA